MLERTDIGPQQWLRLLLQRPPAPSSTRPLPSQGNRAVCASTHRDADRPLPPYLGPFCVPRGWDNEQNAGPMSHLWLDCSRRTGGVYQCQDGRPVWGWSCPLRDPIYVSWTTHSNGVSVVRTDPKPVANYNIVYYYNKGFGVIW